MTLATAATDEARAAGQPAAPDERVAVQAEIHRLRKELQARERALEAIDGRAGGAGIVRGAGQADSTVLRNYKADTPSSSLDRPAAFRTAILATQFTPGARISAVAGTGSMEPVFGQDAYLLLEPAPFDSLREGDIVTYQIEGSKQPVVHRLVRKYGDKFVAKGDNNRRADSSYVTRDNYLMRVFGIVYTRSEEAGSPAAPASARTAIAAMPASRPEAPDATRK